MCWRRLTDKPNTPPQCEPEDRVWPARCSRCVKQKLPCSPPRDALGRDIPYVQDSGGGDDDGGLEPSSWPQPPESSGRAEYTPRTATPAAFSWSSSHRRAGSTSEASASTSAYEVAATPAPVTARPDRDRDDTALIHGGLLPRIVDASRDGGTAVPGEIVRRMEDEFRDVLGQLESRHARDMRAQRDEYEVELRAQRDRYEQRLDDLIRIMRDMGQGRRESTST